MSETRGRHQFVFWDGGGTLLATPDIFRGKFGDDKTRQRLKVGRTGE